MSRSFARWLVALPLVAANAGCASTQAVVPEPSVPPAQLASGALDLREPAESLSAELRVFGVPVGELHTSICADPGVPIRIRTDVEPAPLVSAVHPVEGHADALLARDSGAPLRSFYRFAEGDVERNYKVRYGSAGYTYRYDNGGKAFRSGRIALDGAGPPHDLHSALMALRAWRPRLGEKATLQVVLGRRLWMVEITSLGPEMIQLQDRPQLALKLRGHAVRQWNPKGAPPRERDFTLWLEKSPSRTPLRVEASVGLGEVSLQLTERTTRGSCAVPERPTLASVTGTTE